MLEQGSIKTQLSYFRPSIDIHKHYFRMHLGIIKMLSVVVEKKTFFKLFLLLNCYLYLELLKCYLFIRCNYTKIRHIWQNPHGFSSYFVCFRTFWIKFLLEWLLGVIRKLWNLNDLFCIRSRLFQNTFDLSNNNLLS